jgi:hypothetical protein
VDGTPLTNLTGYVVHYGQSAGQYSETLSLPSATLTSVAIEGSHARNVVFRGQGRECRRRAEQLLERGLEDDPVGQTLYIF